MPNSHRGLCWFACGLLLVAGSSAFAQPRGEGEGYTPQLAPRWIGQLGDKDFWVRWHAAYALGQVGPKAPMAVEPLMRVLENQGEEEYVRGAAAWALGRIGPAAGSAIPLLTRTLASKHVSVRRNSARALGNLGEQAKAAIPDLMKQLGDDDPIAQVYAAGALWKIDRHPQAIPALLRALRGRGTSSSSGEDPAAYEAAIVLGELMPDAEGVVSSLVAALAGSDDDLRRAAIHALAQLGAKSAPPLIDALRDRSPVVRRSAARALGLLGAKAKEAEKPLTEAAGDGDPQVRQMAAWALGRVR